MRAFAAERRDRVRYHAWVQWLLDAQLRRAAREAVVVHDFPVGGWRFRELAGGVHYTIVNGQVLLEEGQTPVPGPAGWCATAVTTPA